MNNQYNGAYPHPKTSSCLVLPDTICFGLALPSIFINEGNIDPRKRMPWPAISLATAKWQAGSGDARGTKRG